jgi:hypothetical protein
MPQTTITAGVSIKRPGPQNYSSDGYTLTLAVDLAAENAEHVRAATHALFAEVKAMLEAEVGGQTAGANPSGRYDLWGGGNGGNGDGRKPASRPAQTSAPADRNRSHPRSETTPDAISNKQAKFLWQLARKSGMKTQDEVGGWLREKLGVEKGVYELSKTEASKAIDILNGNGGAKK